MSNKKRFLAVAILTIIALVCVIAVAACTPQGEEHKCESKCPVCQKCTNKECKEEACKDKCLGHELQEYDWSNVTFANKTVTYNGEEQTLEVAGLPNGVTVVYEYYQGETKLEGAPVNAGTYKVVAKFTGDSDHKAVEDMTATLTIEKADLEVVLGATQYVEDRQYKDLEETVTFTKNDDGSFALEYDGKVYAIVVLSGNVDADDLDVEFWVDVDEDGKIDVDGGVDLLAGDTTPDVNGIVYVLVKIADYAENYEELSANFKATELWTSVTMHKRTVHISDAAGLEILRTDMVNDGDYQLRTKYVLENDIDMNGAVWHVLGAADGSTTFVGEFDGQGFVIKNFVIDKTSVTADEIKNDIGVAFGFWGVLTDAYIHDVAFENFTVDVNVKDLEEIQPEFVNNGSAANPIVFGILAGRTRNSILGLGTIFVNVSVANADVKIVSYGGFYGTFVGEEYAGIGSQYLDPEDNAAEGSEVIRKNLDAKNVRIEAVEISCNKFGRLSVGGLVGELMFSGHIWEDCDLEEITLINGDETVKDGVFHGRADYDVRPGYYTSNVGGFIGLDFSTWAISQFNNCTLKNYRIETWVNNWAYAGIGDYYSGTMRGINGGDATGSGVDMNDCKVENDDDAKYGLFRFNYENNGQCVKDNGTWVQYVFNTETQRWGQMLLNEDGETWNKVENVEFELDAEDNWVKYVYTDGEWRKQAA